MKPIARGFSLIELIVVLAVLAILLAAGASNFSVWMTNSRIRTTAESIQNGLQMARAEAVRRNTPIRFQFVDNLTNACVLSPTVTPTASNWIISFDDPAGDCDAAPLNDAFAVSDSANNPAPRIIQSRAATEGGRNTLIAADASMVTFNGLGRATSVSAAAPVEIDVSPVAAAGTCTSQRCLRVTVSAAGQIRMCDPALDVAGSDPQRCY